MYSFARWVLIMYFVKIFTVPIIIHSQAQRLEFWSVKSQNDAWYYEINSSLLWWVSHKILQLSIPTIIISIRKWCVWHVKLFVEQLSEQIGNWMVKKEIGNQRLNCGMWLYPFCCEIWYTLNITRKQTLSLFLFRRGSSTSPKVCTLQSTWNSTILCTFNLIHPSTRFPEVSLDYIASSGAFTKGLLTD